MPGKNNLENIFQDIATTLKHLFGRTKVIDLTLDFEVENFNGLSKLEIGNKSQALLEKSLVVPLEEKIIARENIPVHFTKLEFDTFSLPIAITTSALNIPFSFNKGNILDTSLIKKLAKIKNLTIEPFQKAKYYGLPVNLEKKKVIDDIIIVDIKPLKIKRKSFKDMSSQNIITYWQALLEQTNLSKESLEFVGVYEPIPLHKLKEIRFNEYDNSISLILDPEKRLISNKNIRLLIGRDKQTKNIFTIATSM